jgi:hypothetical protein
LFTAPKRTPTTPSRTSTGARRRSPRSVAAGATTPLVEDREYIYNQYARRCCYVKDGNWQSTLAAGSFAQQDILVDVAVSYARRQVNDGSQKVYDGHLEEAFAE